MMVITAYEDARTKRSKHSRTDSKRTPPIGLPQMCMSIENYYLKDRK